MNHTALHLSTLEGITLWGNEVFRATCS